MSDRGTNEHSAHWQSLNELSDEQLTASLSAGDQDALVVLFDRYHRLIYSVAMRIVHDAGEAEEVVQTVFIDFYRALANFDVEKGMLKVWLLQYAYHRALHRKRHLIANRFYRWVDFDETAGEPALSWTPNESFETARLMDQLLTGLSARRRTVLELTYLEGMTADEIAAHLSISVNIVRHELYRGLAALRSGFRSQTGGSATTANAAKEARAARPSTI